MPDAKPRLLSLRSRMVSAIPGRAGPMRVQGSTHSGGDLRASLHDVGAVRRGRGVNSAIGLVGIERNELDGNGGCLPRRVLI